MEAASAVGIQLNEKIIFLEDQLHKLTQKLVDKGTIDKTQEKTRQSIRSINERVIEELKNSWIAMPPPLCSFNEYSSMINLYHKEMHDNETARAHDRARALYEAELERNGATVLQLREAGLGFLHEADFSALSTNPKISHESMGQYRADKYVTYESEAAYGQDPVTLKPYARPLRYNKTVTIAHSGIHFGILGGGALVPTCGITVNLRPGCNGGATCSVV